MPESRIIIECPLCRCRMEVPRRGGPAQFTCRNGHRFVRSSRGEGASRRPRAPLLTLVLFALAVAIALVLAMAVARFWLPLGATMRSG